MFNDCILDSHEKKKNISHVNNWERDKHSAVISSQLTERQFTFIKQS